MEEEMTIIQNQNIETMKSIIYGGIFGLVVGDALGVPHEFKSRSLFDKNPVTGMDSYGTYNQPAGTWSDDSSLTLATLDSLSKGLDYYDMMDKFTSWYTEDKYTPFDKVFDIGNATLNAILNYISSKDPMLSGLTDEHSNGNGSLMRMLPGALFISYKTLEEYKNIDDKLNIIHNISALTHKHPRSRLSCGIYSFIVYHILKNKEENNSESLESLVNKGIELAKQYYSKETEEFIEFKKELHHFENIFSLETKNLDKNQIRGSGYVLNSLEASIWCLLNTNCYSDAVLEAVNLGEDTDTTAAIVGSLAGLYYEYDNIPKEWLNTIVKKEYIENITNNFIESLIINK